uniref:Uncharacterized protein n=1 Tax=Chromera velia CCMP2878 TaxID=1169474 RepID=A0A0G4G5F4_9ALVE|eukprot:Cvel_20346.t1-p1 / transcript=Cvel_20346.t1 / gene=Cvel_20346 / organism=Chromera_velia_CCMP2878 / gene_product=hypothetical protein / transcript_product=hypothetical protein / location=Cvel_scaffold1819:1594-8886(-) / protein_length=479 / sequence_SO=supercontig / SO=protein_coding / is_pseudo=false
MMHCFERTITLPVEVAADTETRKPGAGKVLRQRFYANPSGEVLQALWLGVLKPSGFTKVSSTMNVDSEEVGAPPERVFAWMGTHPVFLTLPQAASNSPTLPSIVQEEVDMQMVDGRANHVRVHAIVMNYLCSQDAARNSSFANATVLSEEDALMQSQDFFNLPFVQEKTEEERKGGMATATKILRTLEAAIVTAVLAVRDYYSQFFTAASGPDKASLHYHIWFFDFLIDSWSYTHLLFWKGLFKTFGMGPLSGGTDGKGAQEEADPCAYKLRSRMETLRKSLSLSLSASSDEEGKGQGETAEAIPQAAIEYEVRIRRNQGSSIRPVWPPDDVAGREWVAAFDAAAQPPQKFSAYLSAIKGAMGMTEKSGRDGGERRVRGSLEWPLAGEGRQSELEETVGGRKGPGTSLKEKLVRDHVSAELRRWIDEKRKAGGLEALLVEKEKEAQVFIGQRKAEFETSTEEETQQAESSGGNNLKDEL